MSPNALTPNPVGQVLFQITLLDVFEVTDLELGNFSLRSVDLRLF